MYKYCLFDLDGTLTDPKEGICKSAQYALHKMGIEEPDIDKLEPFIGPPLIDSFMQFYNMSKEDAEKAVTYYRERFSVVGLYENEVYEGIEDMLDALKDRGVRLAVASSKPTVFVQKILEHFNLADFFDAVIGSNLDGTRSAKSEVVEEALLSLYFGNSHDGKKLSDCTEMLSDTAMIGDRKFDIEGAHSMGIVGIGADYGYAEKGELKAAGAEKIAKTVVELEAILLGESLKSYKKNGSKGKADKKTNTIKKDSNKESDKESDKNTETKKDNIKSDKKKVSSASSKGESGFLLARSQESLPVTSFQKSLYVLTPFLLFGMVKEAVIYVGMIAVDKISKGNNEALKNSITYNSAVVSGALSVLALLVAIVVMIGIYHKMDKLNLTVDKFIPVAAVAGLMLALGFNLLIGDICARVPALQRFLEDSTYNKDRPLFMLFLYAGILSPIAEELCFRYLMYGRMKKIYGVTIALITSSVFFGIYHMQLIQGIYAFIMGICMAIVYEWSESILVPIAFHMFANIAIVTSPYLPENVQKIICSVPLTFLWIFMGIGTMLVLKKWSDTKIVEEK